MAADLDAVVDDCRHRPLDGAGPFRSVAANALTMKVREGGRVINAVALLATGVNGDVHREVLGMPVATSETGAAWNEFFANLSLVGLVGSAWSPSTPTAACERRLRPTCRGPPGSVAAPTTPPTSDR